MICAARWARETDISGEFVRGGALLFFGDAPAGVIFFAVDKRDGMGIIKIEHHRQRL